MKDGYAVYQPLATGSNMTNPAVPAQPGEVRLALANLNSEVERLREEVEKLLTAISPISVPVPADEKTSPDPKYSCEIAAEIQDIAQRVRVTKDALVRARSSVQV